jgi:prepilin peptidase CpaA
MISFAVVFVTISVASGCLLAAAAADVRDRLIPNRLVLAITIAGVALRLLAAPRLLWLSLMIWAAAVAVLGFLAGRDLLGWGDVKLIAAVTLLFPPEAAVPLVLAIAIAGGVLACCTLAVRRALGADRSPAKPRRGLAGVLHHEAARIRAREPMPYAVAVLGRVAWQTATEALRCWPATSCWL